MGNGTGQLHRRRFLAMFASDQVHRSDTSWVRASLRRTSPGSSGIAPRRCWWAVFPELVEQIDKLTQQMSTVAEVKRPDAGTASPGRHASPLQRNGVGAVGWKACPPKSQALQAKVSAMR